MLSLILALLLVPQTLSVTVPPDEAFLIAFEYGDAPPAKFRLWCDAVITKNFTNAEVRAGKSASPNGNGEYTYRLSAPGLSLAPHVCKACVFDADGIERCSDPILLQPRLLVVEK